MKKWETPKLIVLVRGKPEELLLFNCKISGSSPWAPSGADTACVDFPVPTCPQCVELIYS
jgi:hypothetical protein